MPAISFPQLSDLRKGIYIEEGSSYAPLDFCVGVAGYPEKHFEAANLKSCIQQMKAKVDAGAHYIVTQMFFDNEKFHSYVKACREAGITVPIIPGLKIIRSLNQLKSLPRTFNIDVPAALSDEIMASPDHVVEIGARWAKAQVEDLLAHDQKNIHFYVMNDAPLIASLTKGFL